MKLEGVGAVLFRMTAVAFVLKGATLLVNLTCNYPKLVRLAQSNAALRDGLHQSVKTAIWSGVLSVVCGGACWLLSTPLGRLLTKGLEPLSELMPATGVNPAGD